MYQISSFQRWLANTYSNTNWKISPFWVWMADKYKAIKINEDNLYNIKGSSKQFALTDQERYMEKLLRNYHYPLTSDQIIKLMNAKVVVSQYEYN